MNTTTDRSGLQMSLPARADNVAVVRHAVAGLAERLGMDAASVADLKTVVTEACMNVVVHAYPEQEGGLLEVEAVPDDDAVSITVRDYGRGIQPRPGLERDSLRIGLSLIAALSDSFEIRGGVDRGTEIAMRVPLTARERSENGDGRRGAEDRASESAARVKIGPPELVGAVLGRVVAALAARREIGVDRLSDAMLLSDAIAASAPAGFADGHVSLSVVDAEEGVVLRLGPMRSGAATELRQSLELPAGSGTLEALADEVGVERDEQGEFLVLAIA